MADPSDCRFRLAGSSLIGLRGKPDRRSLSGTRTRAASDSARSPAHPAKNLNRDGYAAEGPITPAARTPRTSSVRVSSRCRVGVSQDGARAMSQARSPVAVAPADIAPIMHCVHMLKLMVRPTGPRDGC